MEKKTQDENVKALEDSREQLVEELERARARLRELEELHRDMDAREDHLLRQRNALEESIGHEEQGETGTVHVQQQHWLVHMCVGCLFLFMFSLSAHFVNCPVTLYSR